MKEKAPNIWQKGSRLGESMWQHSQFFIKLRWTVEIIVDFQYITISFCLLGFCYVFRDGKKCGMKDGNPFGPFWNHFGVDFDGYVDHPGILWDTQHERTALEWNRRYL